MDDSFNDLKERWINKAEEIKKQKLNNKSCVAIIKGLIKETLYLTSQLPSKGKYYKYECEKIKNDVLLALLIAYSNYDQFMRQKVGGIGYFLGIKR